MKVRYFCTLHPKGTPVAHGAWMVVLYVPLDPVYDAKGARLERIKAVGKDLPVGSLLYDLDGVWERNQYGLQFAVSSAETLIERDREGIIGYLSSGEVKGCGPKLAERIYNAFGDKTLDVIENNPDRLLEIHGISKVTVKNITESYQLANGSMRRLLMQMSSLGISEKLARRIYEEYQDESMDIIRKSPFKLCELNGVSFAKADEIALRQNMNPVCEERICQGILYVLSEEETKGNICTDYPALLQKSFRLLKRGELVMSHIEQMVDKMAQNGTIIHYHNSFYRRMAWEAEFGTAVELKRLLFSPIKPISDLEEKMQKEERYLKIVFNAEQKQAIRTVLSNSVSIITGGPGTGKTRTMVAILDIFHKEFPKLEIVCCAPTGQAARRMYESTGYPAYTMHKTLQLVAGDEEQEDMHILLEAGLILCDEFSMTDAYLAPKLFAAVMSGARLGIIGDVEQLPSVGPGAVLKQLIESEIIPTVRLQTVYRNAGLIALNAKRIKNGNLSIEENASFQIMNIPDIPRLIDSVQELYAQEVERVGVENVILLSPRRKKSDIGVNAMNKRLQEMINPADEGKKEWEIGNVILREGDRIVQMRNTEIASNGEIGFSRRFGYNSEGEEVMFCEFGVNRFYPYTAEDCENLDLAYCNTVHKAQGGEYKSVIIICHSEHAFSLTKSLLYTAVTRAKEKVTICGERAAIVEAVRNTGENRNSHLKDFLRDVCLGGNQYDHCRETA